MSFHSGFEGLSPVTRFKEIRRRIREVRADQEIIDTGVSDDVDAAVERQVPTLEAIHADLEFLEELGVLNEVEELIEAIYGKG
jgi:hypothetical protein